MLSINRVDQAIDRNLERGEAGLVEAEGCDLGKFLELFVVDSDLIERHKGSVIQNER